MFFIRAGAIVAWLAVGLGVLRFLMGLGLAFISDPKLYLGISQKFLGGAGAVGAMYGGVLIFVAGILIGLLVQIAKQNSLRDNQ